MSDIRLRPATVADQPMLERWDEDEDVTSSSGNDHRDTDGVYENGYWTHELAIQSDVYEYFIAEVREDDSWRPIGAIQIIDPHREPTHYWGEIEPNLRAIDIWLGEPGDRGKGYGELAMTAAVERCFAPSNVAAIIIDPLNSNTRAIKFYQRMGFVPTHRQTFGDDDCLVHKLTRAQWRARHQGD
jgi:aminoglycoside 6'-N-acetyltransferase